ncbi:MAG: hypothetical protein IKX36_02495 [Prevotella sp.]|nr:hypothetical protein [Prevotella sp.]
MKKIILLLGALMMTFSLNAQTTDIDALDNVIYVEPTTAGLGTQTVLSVQMKNTAEVSSFEIRIQLPEGITFATDEDGFILAELSTDRTTSAKMNTFMTALQDDGTLKILCASSNADPNTGKLCVFDGNEGEVARVTIEVPADYAEGEYEVSVLGGKTANADGVKTTLESPITTILTVADNTVILDENNLDEIPTTETAVPVKMIRPLKAGIWSTVCFPFAMTESQIYDVFGEDVQLQTFANDYETEDTDPSDDVVDRIVIHFKNIDLSEGLNANTPCLIKVSQDIDEFTLTTQLVPNEEEAFVEYTNGKTGRQKKSYGFMIGTFKAETTVPEYDLFLSSNKFYYSTGLTKMKAFRAYFELNDVTVDLGAGANIDFVFGETTGIDGINSDSTSAEGYYTIDGRKLNKKPTQKGVYIYNGKKQVVK